LAEDHHDRTSPCLATAGQSRSSRVSNNLHRESGRPILGAAQLGNRSGNAGLAWLKIESQAVMVHVKGAVNVALTCESNSFGNPAMILLARLLRCSSDSVRGTVES
jgi:hypothetical protein